MAFDGIPVIVGDHKISFYEQGHKIGFPIDKLKKA